MDEVHNGGIGLIRQLEHRVHSIPRSLSSVTVELEEARVELTAVERRIGAPSPHTEALAAAQARVDDIDRRLHDHAEQDRSGHANSEQSAPRPQYGEAPAVGSGAATSPSRRTVPPVPLRRGDSADYDAPCSPSWTSPAQNHRSR